MVYQSDILDYDDKNWPKSNNMGTQELEIVLNNEHISFNVFFF
jgi:hypothetical protein